MIGENKLDLSGICVVEVSGESCANCITLMPVLASICSQRNDVRLVHVEADATTMDFIEKYQIRHVPTILLMDNGEVFARAVGFQPEEILSLWMDAKISEQKNK